MATLEANPDTLHREADPQSNRRRHRSLIDIRSPQDELSDFGTWRRM